MSTETIIVGATLRHVRRQNFKHAVEFIEARAQLHRIGDQSPYFSLTGTEKDKYGETGGCIHDKILEQWPDLKPLAEIHLSDSDGVPMHAVENGWYWAGGCREWCKGEKNDPPNAQFLANHLRIGLEQAQTIVERVKAGELNKDEFHAFVESQKPRWKQEAQTALELIKSLGRIA